MLDGLSTIENFFSNREEETYIRVGDPQALDKFYKAIQKDFNLDELKDVLDCEDNMLLVSSAGSGKTTTLILKIIRDYLSGKLMKKAYINGAEELVSSNILVSTFLKSGASDLTDKFNELVNKYNIKGIDTRFISFRTIHSEVYNALVSMGISPNIVQDTDTYKYIRKACKDFNIHSVMSGKGKDLTNEEIGDIACLLTYSRNRLDSSKYDHPLMAEYGMGEIELKAVLDEFKTLKMVDGVQDFEDLEEMLYDAYDKFPKVVEHIKKRYDYIYIDEFQDTSQLQYAILKPYLDSAKGFIAVGDDDQCLCEDTVVYTKDGKKLIQDIKIGDFVLSGVGKDELEYMPVDNISKKYINTDIVVVKTKSGKILKGTEDHIIFTKLPPIENTIEVYLMYRHDIGFRIGQVIGKRRGSKGEEIQGITQRLNREKGDRVWVLKQCETREDARYWESYFSYKYAIPQYMFKLEKSMNPMFTDETLRKLHKELDTYTNGMKLLKDMGLSFDFPHFLPKVKEEKCSLNYTMFMGKKVSTKGVYYSDLSVSTTKDDYVDIIAPYLNICKKQHKNYTPYWHFRTASVDIDLQHYKIKQIMKDAEKANIPLVVKKKIKLTKGSSFNFMPLGNVIKGMILPIYENNAIIEDEVIEVSRETYLGYVYDISVPNTRNFIANSVFVHNCIYSWRGSDVSLIQEKFQEDYKPIVRKLTVNRRCSENILAPVVPSIEKNEGRHKKVLRASKQGGEVKIIVDGGAGYLMECINKDLFESKKIGILGRTNADLLIPALLLELDGYSSFSLSKSVSLSDRIPSIVLGIMELITQRYNEKFESYFKLFLNKYNVFQATKLCDILSTTPEYSIYNLPLEDIQYSAPDLFSIIRMLRSEVAENPVMAYVSLLEIMEQDVYNGKTIYAQRARDFIYYIRKMILEHKKLQGLTIDELYVLFTKTLAQSLEKKKPKLTKAKSKEMLLELERSKKDEPFVRITTVHDAKGKQWDTVYIWNDVNGCFPNSVGNRPLTKEEFEEERRVHYIAWTRAVEKLTVFTRSDRLDGFLSECDLSNAEIIEMSENRRFMNTDSSKVKKMLLANSKPKKVVEQDDKCTKAVRNYVNKYTGYSYICTTRGTNLDICLVKVGNIDNLIAKLKAENLESYPDDMLEDVISDMIEKFVNELN